MDGFQILQNFFKEQLGHFQALKTILKKEREAIAADDTTLLTCISEEKEQLTINIENTNHLLDPLFTEKKLSFNLNNIKLLFRDFEPSKQHILTNQLNKLRVSMQETQELNSINGAVIAINLTNLQRINHILSGRDIRNDLYSANGKMSSQHVSRTSTRI